MKAGFSVWLEENGRFIAGEKEASILRGIRKFGSIMATAKSLGMTYAHVWNEIEELSKRVGKPVVSAYRGGEAGGGTRLTKEGEQLLQEYLMLEEKVSNFMGASKEYVFKEIRNPDLSIIGSSCPGIKILADLIKGISTEVVEVGSSAGLTAVMLGEADIAGMHLYDTERKTYNEEAIRKVWPSGAAVLIRGYIREQGLMLKKGNPKKVKSLEDAIKKKVRIVNRNLGSGTRELLDRLLKERIIQPENVRGYDFEVRTHEEVAKALNDGKADIGLGLKAVARVFNLEFVKICDEHFDFMCEKRRLQKPAVKAFIDALKSEEFKAELEKRAPGIKAVKGTGEILEIKA
jgi:molybdate transport repressor ModE-like protein